MKALKTALVVIFLMVAFGIVGRMDKEDAQRIERNYATVYVAEDDMFWDCTTSGNFICGEPITNWPTPGAIVP